MVAYDMYKLHYAQKQQFIGYIFVADS